MNWKEWLRFRLSTLLIAYVLLAVMMTALAPGALSIGHRLGFVTLLILPAWLGWKCVIYQTPFLLCFGSGLSIGVLAFLALCFSELIEAKLTTGAAHMTIGVVGSIVGYATARTMIAASDISAVSQLGRFRFRSLHILLIALTGFLTLLFAGGRSYVAWVRNSQIELSETVGNWDATLFFEQTDLPWNLDCFLNDKVLVPRGISFYDQVPAEAVSLLTLHDTITIVGLRGENIDDESLARIPASLKLEHLILFSTRITDNGMRLLLRWPRIVEFYLFDTPITLSSVKRLAQLDLIKVIAVIGSQVTPVEEETIRQLSPRNAYLRVAPIRPGQEYPDTFPRHLRAIVYGDAPHLDKKLHTIDLSEWRLWMASDAFK